MNGSLANSTNKLKVVVLGKSGQLAKELQKLRPNFIYLDRSTLDLSQSKKIVPTLATLSPDVILNCAAYTAVDLAETNKETCFAINSLAPAEIAKCAQKVLHVSTDYVFDGSSPRPYQETDPTNPINCYGLSKRDGETAFLATNQDGVVIRTGWLYSKYGVNFVTKIRQLARSKPELKVVYDQIGTPTSASDLAKLLVTYAADPGRFPGGVYHYSNSGVCSWYDLAHAILKYENLKTPLTPVLSTEFPTAAKRPQMSVLDKTKITALLEVKIPHWQDSLARVLSEIKAEP